MAHSVALCTDDLRPDAGISRCVPDDRGAFFRASPCCPVAVPGTIILVGERCTWGCQCLQQKPLVGRVMFHSPAPRPNITDARAILAWPRLRKTGMPRPTKFSTGMPTGWCSTAYGFTASSLRRNCYKKFQARKLKQNSGSVMARRPCACLGYKHQFLLTLLCDGLI